MLEKVLLFIENGFEDRELMYPYYRFQEAGYKVNVVGPQLPIEARVVKEKKGTRYVSASTDLKNAGGIYLNKSVVWTKT